MTEDLQKRAMAVDYAIKALAAVGKTDMTFMQLVNTIYNFLKEESK